MTARSWLLLVGEGYSFRLIFYGKLLHNFAKLLNLHQKWAQILDNEEKTVIPAKKKKPLCDLLWMTHPV